MPAGVAPLGAARRGRAGLAGASGASAALPVAVLRLSGIYGPGRNAFVNLANGTARRLVKPGQVFNRIHVADIAGALRHLAQSADRAASSTSPTTSRRRRRTSSPMPRN